MVSLGLTLGAVGFDLSWGLWLGTCRKQGPATGLLRPAVSGSYGRGYGFSYKVGATGWNGPETEVNDPPTRPSTRTQGRMVNASVMVSRKDGTVGARWGTAVFHPSALPSKGGGCGYLVENRQVSPGCSMLSR